MADDRAWIEKRIEAGDFCIRVLASHANPASQEKAKDLLGIVLDQLLNVAPAKPAKEA